MLIHGTTPKPLYGILFEGLDPALSKKGLFGNGTYLAEDALLRMLHSMVLRYGGAAVRRCVQLKLSPRTNRTGYRKGWGRFHLVDAVVKGYILERARSRWSSSRGRYNVPTHGNVPHMVMPLTGDCITRSWSRTTVVSMARQTFTHRRLYLFQGVLALRAWRVGAQAFDVIWMAMV